MDDKLPGKVDYLVHESMMVRLERTIKRLWILCILVFIALVVTNAGWIWYESQFVEEIVTQDIDTGDGDAVVAGIGDINYGESQTDG